MTTVCEISYELMVNGESQGTKTINYVNPNEVYIACIQLVSNQVNFNLRFINEESL